MDFRCVTSIQSVNLSKINVSAPEKLLSVEAPIAEIKKWADLRGRDIPLPNKDDLSTKISWAHALLLQKSPGHYKSKTPSELKISVITSLDFAFVSTKVVIANKGTSNPRVVSIACKVNKTGEVLLAVQLKKMIYHLDKEMNNLIKFRGIAQVVRFYYKVDTYSEKKRTERSRIYEEFCSGGPIGKQEFTLSFMKECIEIASSFATMGYSILDFKDDNLVIDAQGRVRMIDLEAVTKINVGDLVFSHLIHSPLYTAPEIIELRGTATNIDSQLLTKQDSFSLGVTFYLLLFGLPQNEIDHWVIRNSFRKIVIQKDALDRIVTRLRGSSLSMYKLIAALLEYNSQERISPQAALDHVNALLTPPVPSADKP
jgi:hypothetical protein